MRTAVRSLALIVTTLVLACSSTVNQHAAALHSMNADDRMEAAQALNLMGRDARKALPDLILATRDSSAEIRRMAVETMGMIGKPALEGTHALITTLQDSVASVRRAAAVSIMQLGAFPTIAFPACLRALGDPDTLVRQFTMGGFLDLGTLGVPTLRRGLRDSSAMVRQTAAKTLGLLGEEAVSAKSALKKATEDYDLEVAREAEEALKMIESRSR